MSKLNGEQRHANSTLVKPVGDNTLRTASIFFQFWCNHSIRPRTFRPTLVSPVWHFTIFSFYTVIGIKLLFYLNSHLRFLEGSVSETTKDLSCSTCAASFPQSITINTFFKRWSIHGGVLFVIKRDDLRFPWALHLFKISQTAVKCLCKQMLRSCGCFLVSEISVWLRTYWLLSIGWILSALPPRPLSGTLSVDNPITAFYLANPRAWLSA